MEVADILEEYGYRGTFNVCLKNVVHHRKDGRQRMFPDSDVLTWEEVQELQERGHEIASHGTRHVDLHLCNHQEKLMELAESKGVFISRGIHVTSYTCAFNAYDAEIVMMGYDFYESFRGHVGTNYYPPEGKMYHCNTPELVDEIIKAQDQNIWYVAAWHDPDLSRFRKHVEKIHNAEGIKVITVREAYEA